MKTSKRTKLPVEAMCPWLLRERLEVVLPTLDSRKDVTVKRRPKRYPAPETGPFSDDFAYTTEYQGPEGTLLVACLHLRTGNTYPGGTSELDPKLLRDGERVIEVSHRDNELCDHCPPYAVERWQLRHQSS